MKIQDGDVVAITGGSSGLGRALAIMLAERGCDLAICSNDLTSSGSQNLDGLKETAERASAFGVTVSFAQVDVADREQVYNWADQVVEDHGKVNLVVNNAGVGLASTVEGIDYSDFEWLMNINFWGVVYGTKAFLPHLKAAGRGHIANISSLFGIIGMPTLSAYNASKFAVHGFTDSLREELDMMDCGVSATSIHPGGIKTNLAHASKMAENVATLGIDSKSFSQKMNDAFITKPEKAADKVISAIESDQRRALIGPDAQLMDIVTRLLPGSYQWLAIKMLRSMQ